MKCVASTDSHVSVVLFSISTIRTLMLTVWGLLVVLCLLASVRDAVAQSTPSSARPATAALAASSGSPSEGPRASPTQAELDLIVVKAQAATMKEYHSSLLDTVYWALGVVVTVALLVSGFSWYSTFRVYEADKKDLRRDMEANDKQVLAEVDAKLGASASRVIEQFEAKLFALTDRFEREADISREAWASEKKGLTESVVKLEAATEALKQGEVRLLRGLHYSETKLRRVEEHMWESEGVLGNVLLTQSQGLAAALKGEYKNTVRSILERMIDTAKKMVAEKEDLSKSSLDGVAEDVKKARDLESILANAALEEIAKIPVRKRSEP